jgi:hypothetical protein
VGDRCGVLADKTNSNSHMELRRRKRNVVLPQPDMNVHKKPCIYKLGNTVCNQDLLPQDRLALYNFEVDENEPLPNKKQKKKRKVRHRKKKGLLDSEYKVDKRLLSAATQKKQDKNMADTRQHDVGAETETSVAGVVAGSESEPSLLFSPIEKCPLRSSTFGAVRWPAHGIQSVEDFTVHNYFGFDEESDDDLRLSLSPVKMAPHSKPVSSGPSAASSTPNLKPLFARSEATSMNVMQNGAQTRTALVPIQSAAVPKHPPASSVGPPDKVDAGRDPSPPVLFVDGSESATHFMKVSLTTGILIV